MSETAKFDFECGDCTALAVALHQATGLPMFAVVDFDAELQQVVLVHAYIKTESKEYPIFDVLGPGTLGSVLDRYPNSGDTAEIAIDEQKLLAMAYLPTNAPDIDAVMPFARELLDAWKVEFGETFKPLTKPEATKRSMPSA